MPLCLKHLQKFCRKVLKTRCPKFIPDTGYSSPVFNAENRYLLGSGRTKSKVRIDLGENFASYAIFSIFEQLGSNQIIPLNLLRGVL